MDNSLVEWGAFIFVLGICAIVVGYWPAFQVDPRITSFFLWSGVIAIIVGILLAAWGSSREPQEISPPPVPSWKSGVILLLVIMGIVILALGSYYAFIFFRNLAQLGISFFDLSQEAQIVFVLVLMMSFSVGLTEFIVSWLLGKSKEK